MRSLLRTLFYGIKVIPLTTLEAMRIGSRDAIYILVPGMLYRSYNPPKTAMATVFPLFSSIFDNFINIHEYANEIILFRPKTSIHLSYDTSITGSITKCHIDTCSLVLKVVY